MRHQAITLALAALLAVPASHAATPINQSRPLDARGTVEIENIKGRIQVRVWDKPEVRITGSLGKGAERLVVEGGGDRLLVRVQYPRSTGGWGDAKAEPTELLLQVPVLASLEIESVAADVDVVGSAGRSLAVDSVSGDVTIAAAPGRADIESVSGDLQLTLNSNDVSTESVSGDLRLSGRLAGEIHAETVSGDLDIDTRGEKLRRLSTATVSGDATVKAMLADGASVNSESVSGTIRLLLPRALSARVRGESFSGDLDAPGANVQRPKFGPGASFDHRYGAGNADIRLETFSGDVELVLQ